MITVAPRLLAKLLDKADLLPLGDKVWGNTTVDMPFHQYDKQYTCAFTGTALQPTQRRSGWSLPVAQLLAAFPVGLIVAETVEG